MRQLITVALWAIMLVLCVELWQENRGLRGNIHALEEGITLYRTKANRSAASVEALTLRLNDFKRQHEEDCKTIRSMEIRLRRMESYAKSVTATTLRDTVFMRDTVVVGDSVLHARYTTPWTTLHALLRRDTLSFEVVTYDTLHQVIHRVPRRLWFIPYGTKAIRQEVTTSNPNTRLVYTEYIELE